MQKTTSIASKKYNQEYTRKNLPRLMKANRERRKNNPRKYQLKDSERNQIIKRRVISHYSGGTPKCKRCGIEDLRCLEIDHMSNNGSKDRRRNLTGNSMYYYLIREGYPEDFQILCRNCNWIKHVEALKNKRLKNN